MKIKTFDTINETEANELIVIENIIQRGLGTFLEVGEALLKIRDGRLYRASHVTFEELLPETMADGAKTRVTVDRRSGRRQNLGPIGPIPSSESQIRPLTMLPPEKQLEVWTEVIKHHPHPTARQVRTVVQKMAPESISDAPLRILKTEPTREERCCALFEVLGPELQQLKDQFNDLPAIHDILAQCLDGLWLCQEDLRERAQLTG